MRELWRQIPWAERYEVSNQGRIKNIKTGRILKQRVSPSGYQMVTLCHSDGRHETCTVHRVVAKVFIPNPENKRDVNHKDGNKLNNRLWNLEWLTHSENIKHRYRVLGNMNSGWMVGAKAKERPVFCLELGVSYDSAVKAELSTGIKREGISACCNRRLRTAGGVVWRFRDEIIFGE